LEITRFFGVLGEAIRMTFSPLRATLAAAAVAISVAASPARSAQPSDPAALTQMLGKPVTSVTFVALGGAPRPLAVPGRPTVVVAFASWCHACIQEMPRTLSEYAKYHDRVTFLGIDYSDPPVVAKQLVAHFGIPFPVESYVPRAPAPPAGKTRKIVLPDTITAQQVLSLKTQLPPADYQKVDDVYRARSTMTPEQFHAYEQWMGVSFEDPRKIAAERNRSAVLGLPHTFVIDRNGIVTKILEGYDPSNDRVQIALAALGIR
jgi:thiol-disulfide isomerase/thioredoxin